MNANRKAKIQKVAEIKAKFEKAKSVVVVEYAGLSVKELQKLRKNLKEKNVELKVYKNRLVKLATKEIGLEGLHYSLSLQNAFAFGMEDDIAPAKILSNFANNNDLLKLKSGIFEGKVINEKEVKEVASLPSWDEAVAKLALQLISPIKYVGMGMNELIQKNIIKE